MNTINLSTYQPIADIQDNILFANNGNVVLCYKGNLPEIYSLSEKDFEDMHGAWFQALKSLPVGTVVHKQDVYLKKQYTAEELPYTTFLQKATSDHFKGRKYIDHNCYLFFTLTKNKALNNPKYVNPFRKVSKTIIQELKDYISTSSGKTEAAPGCHDDTVMATAIALETLRTHYDKLTMDKVPWSQRADSHYEQEEVTWL